MDGLGGPWGSAGGRLRSVASVGRLEDSRHFPVRDPLCNYFHVSKSWQRVALIFGSLGDGVKQDCCLSDV